MSSILIEVPIDPNSCQHDSVEDIGHEGGASFLRCSVCGSIMILEHGHRWIIRPTDESGPRTF